MGRDATGGTAGGLRGAKYVAKFAIVVGLVSAGRTMRRSARTCVTTGPAQRSTEYLVADAHVTIELGCQFSGVGIVWIGDWPCVADAAVARWLRILG